MAEATTEAYALAAGGVAIGPISLLLAWLLAWLWHRPKAKDPPEATAQTAQEPRQPRERVLYFDAWRVLCVGCVVVTHANESYADWNIAAVQQWVLQVILIISGTCYAMSRASWMHLVHYESRLFAIFSFGVALNWLGLVAAGEDWWTDVPDKVYFQMAFIGLMIIGAWTAFPLKAFLDMESMPSAAKAIVWYAILSASLAACWIHFVGLQDRTDLEVALRAMTLTMGMLLLTMLLLLILPDRHRGLCGWLLLIWLYATPVATRNPRVGYWCHLVDIYNWSVLVQRVPLAGSSLVGFILVQMWPFWSVAGGLVSIFPGTQGRKDKFPFDDLEDRAQYYLLEILFIVAFVAIPTAGRAKTVTLSEAWRDNLPWLNLWALLAFCGHQAVYYVIGGRPWGLTFMVLSPVVFFAIWRLTKRERRSKQTTVPSKPLAPIGAPVKAVSDPVIDVEANIRQQTTVVGKETKLEVTAIEDQEQVPAGGG